MPSLFKWAQKLVTIQIYHKKIQDNLYTMEVTKTKKRRSWDRPQDNELLNCIIELGPRSWEDLAVKISGRTGK